MITQIGNLPVLIHILPYSAKGGITTGNTTNLQELCRDKKLVLGKTSADIAAGSGIPLPTVNNFLSRPSKSPSVYTVAPICAELGISLDEYFGIAPSPALVELRERDLHIAHLEGRLEQMERTIAATAKADRQRRGYTIALLCLCVVLVAVVIAYISFDASIGNAGLIQGGKISVFAIGLILVVVATVAVMCRLLVGIVKRAAPEPPMK